MDPIAFLLIAAVTLGLLGWFDQARRITLLSRLLGRYQIEKLMERLNNGYMRALSLQDPDRQREAFEQQNATETELAEQLTQLAHDMERLPPNDNRISRLPMVLSAISRFIPGATFPLSDAMALHARGVAELASLSDDDEVSSADAIPPKSRAHQLLAELLLMQHTCHWYCRGLGTASARLVQRHQTDHQKVLASVSEPTRRAYRELTSI